MNDGKECAVVWEELEPLLIVGFYGRGGIKLSPKLSGLWFRKIALYGNFQHLKFLDGDIRLQLDCFFRLKAMNSFDDSNKPFTQTWAEPYCIVTDYIQEPLIAPYKVQRMDYIRGLEKSYATDVGPF